MEIGKKVAFQQFRKFSPSLERKLKKMYKKALRNARSSYYSALIEKKQEQPQVSLQHSGLADRDMAQLSH